MPVAGSVWVERLKLAAPEVDEVSWLPSGLNNATFTEPIELPVNRTVACWVAVPSKVSRARWPTLLIVIGTDEPFMVTAPPFTSEDRVNVTLPVVVL